MELDQEENDMGNDSHISLYAVGSLHTADTDVLEFVLSEFVDLFPKAMGLPTARVHDDHIHLEDGAQPSGGGKGGLGGA